MYRLAFRVALAVLVVAGVAFRSLLATATDESPQQRPHQTLISGLPVLGGPAAVRAGSSPSPEQGAQSPATAGGPAIPRLAAVAAATGAREAVADLLADPLPLQRGPPPGLA